MSHTTLREADRADQQITNIPALQRAALRCGLEFMVNQTKFASYATDHGRLVGDSPMPQGMTAADYIKGECVHAIRIPTDKRDASDRVAHYEIGVVPSRKFPGTYSLAYDSWMGPRQGLEKFAGDDLERLDAFYRAEVSREQAMHMGDQYSEVVLPDGTIEVEIDTTVRLGF